VAFWADRPHPPVDRYRGFEASVILAFVDGLEPPQPKRKASQMTTLSRKLNKRNRGQGMTEYIIIVALIAIAAVGIVTVFGQNIRQLFGDSTDVLAGNTTTSNRGQMSSVGSKGLKNFGTETQQ
jgi:pilus assembly protein Flp/PilA